MIKVEVIKDFTLGRFDEIVNLKRKGKDDKGYLYVGDTFECEKELCDYLMGANIKNAVVIKVIEVIPAIKKVEPIEEVYQEPETITAELRVEKKSKKKTSKKK